MNDPLVVAFEIRRPWPRRQRRPLSRHSKRWEIAGSHWQIAGRPYYWPSMITVWHREPGGKDSGEVCRQHERVQGANGGWQWKFHHGWRLHVHHWKVQVRPLQRLRRRLLTRCAWCGGREGRRDPINIRHQWGGSRGRWWRGEHGLYHHDCSSVQHAHKLCQCTVPVLDHGDHGQCQVCGLFRAFRQVPRASAALLATVPEGERPSVEVMRRVRALWEQERESADA